MRRKIAFIAVIVAVLAIVGWYFGRPDTLPSGNSASLPPQAPTVQTVNGETVVILAADIQRASNINVEPLTASVIRPEQAAYASVVNVQPLIDLRYRIAAAREDVEKATATANASREQYQRNQALIKNSNSISEKTLQDAGATMQADQDILDAANVTKEGLIANLRLQFGDAITSAIGPPPSDLFQRLSNGSAALLLVSLPAKSPSPAPDEIAIDGLDGQRIPAHKISASPQTDPTVQGNPYFYIADHTMPAGTHTIAHIPLSGENTPGVLIPESAVLWYGGQRWVYVNISADHFARRPVSSGASVSGGFMVTSGFRPGDKVVVQGAQLLLSEELRPHGIATQCKDPPECDG
jgi:hypothetical protein